MSVKKGNGVPTIGTANIGRQKSLDVESAEELAPNGKGTAKLRNEASKLKNKKKNCK